MCGYSDAIARGHTLESMTRDGFTVCTDPVTGKTVWKVGDERDQATCICPTQSYDHTCPVHGAAQ